MDAWLLWIVASLGKLMENTDRFCARIRRSLLSSLIHAGTRDMVYLTNDTWVDVGSGYPAEQFTWRYDAEHHRILRSTERIEERAGRWHWLSVVEESSGRDMSDFFAGLRISSNATISGAQALSLFTHQKGWMPQGTLVVIDRYGAEHRVNARTGLLNRSANPIPDVDHIQ